MDKAKRQKLEAKGWKFGSAGDFLGLSAEDDTYIELRLRLVDALKSLRSAKVSQIEFAEAIGSSQSRVAKMEANDSSVSLDLIVKGLVSLGVTLPELGKILTGKKPGAKVGAKTFAVAAKNPPRRTGVMSWDLTKGEPEYVSGKYTDVRMAKTAVKTTSKLARKK